MEKVGDRVFLMILAAGLTLFAGQAKAADYTVSDEASCLSFASAIGTTAGWNSSEFCTVIGGTLAAADSVTFSGSVVFRPQSDPFTNLGTITIDSSGRGFYGASLLTNEGTFDIVAASDPENYSDIVNEGVFRTVPAFENYGSFTNACGATIEGTILGNAVIDECGVSVSPVGGLLTSEAGGTADFDVVLDSEPSADVSIDFSTSDTSEGLVSTGGGGQQSSITLTFTGANWDVAQTVTVHGQDDSVNDDDQAYAVQSSATSSAEPVWNGVPVSDVSVTNSDDDESSITISRASGLVTNEGGASDSFTMVLSSEPTADVTIDLSSSDTSESTVLPSTVTFTNADWNSAQTVTITGVDDDLADSDQAYIIVTAPAVSADSTYSGLDPVDVGALNRDDETSADDGDGDNIDDLVEDAGPNAGDGNGDGILDSTQPDVASFPSAAADSGMQGYITLMSTCQLRDVRAVAKDTLDPTPLNLPYGLVEFRVPCMSTDLTVLYHASDSWAEDTSYWKFGPTTPGVASTTKWYRFPSAIFDIVDVFGAEVARARFSLTDGGYGDATGTDGQIIDPGAAGTGSSTFQVPTLSSWALLLLAFAIGAVGYGLLRTRALKSARYI
ncbi:MAG: IPTL-CTERM sorting domain-containing protein [Xanthomonadales bacterium]|nr:IPTL-CTERM sorting domain-containing protein [Xanthomonadales bacterium]